MTRLRPHNPPKDLTGRSSPERTRPELTSAEKRADARYRREQKESQLPPRPLTSQEQAQKEREIRTSQEGRARQPLVVRQTKYLNPVLIRQKESDLLTKLANILRAEERRPKGERDHELIAAINRTMEDLKRQRKQRGQRGCD